MSKFCTYITSSATSVHLRSQRIFRSSFFSASRITSSNHISLSDAGDTKSIANHIQVSWHNRCHLQVQIVLDPRCSMSNHAHFVLMKLSNHLVSIWLITYILSRLHELKLVPLYLYRQGIQNQLLTQFWWESLRCCFKVHIEYIVSLIFTS